MMDTACERSKIYCAFAAAFRGVVSGDEVEPLSISFPKILQDSNAEFLSAFDQAISRSACSLYGGDYTKQERTSLFEDLVQFYKFFGLKRPDNAELPDHVSVELEFMHYLTYREQKAYEQAFDITDIQKAQRDFLDRHLKPLADKIRMKCVSHPSHYVELTQKFADYTAQDHADLDAILPAK